MYDRTRDKAYREAVKKAKAAKRTPPGRWIVRYYDPAGQQKSGGVFQQKTKAEKWQLEIESSLFDNTYRDPDDAKAKLRDIAEKWLDARSDLKKTTWWKYRGLLDNHVLPRWGDLPVSAIHNDDIATWVAWLQKPRAEGGANLGASQTRHCHRVLSMILQGCVPRRIASNPAKDVPLPKASEVEHCYLTYEQVENLANAAARLRTKYNQTTAGAHINRALILLLAYSGLRWNEAVALRVKRVDLRKLTVRVVVAFAEVKGELIEQPPKNGKSRTVAIPASLAVELKPLIEGRPENDLVFTTKRGKALRAANWRSREFNPAVAAAGLDGLGLTPHKLRHTAASLSIAAGADVKVLQEMLGHSSATMTLDIYGHLFPNRLDEVAARLDEKRLEAVALAA
ncbi:tyrosine-type recombinase/integrase [Marinitenerispora sediminis]|uniref:tyrosine-type recombinase/integrase n=1 Tax=Marinitenerispora sediminis TaxID=1931232 RepID=UPI001F238C70|nr:site-specific integrase [Marinitenerispora sediminis]